MDLSNIEISFAYGEGDNPTRREILRNVRTLLATPLGACPLYRDFGIDTAILDNPTPVAENLMAVEIMDAVERWEPRVRVTDVTFQADQHGKLHTKVVIAWTTS